MIFSFLPGRGYGFYQSDESPKEGLFQAERKYAISLDVDKSFAIYDNLGGFPTKLVDKTMLYRHTTFFVPADIVSCNLPLYIDVRHFVTVESSLADLIHANLMLKKLLEKHEYLQKRARKVLAGLDVPFIDFRIGSFNPTATELSIHNIWVDFNRGQQIAAQHTGLPNQTGMEALTALRTRLQRTERSELYLTAGPISRRSGRKQLYLSGADQTETRTDRIANRPQPPPRHEEHHDAPPNVFEQDKIQSAYDKSSDVPWLVRIPFHIVTYTVANPFEVSLYFVLLCLFLSLFRSRRSH